MITPLKHLIDVLLEIQGARYDQELLDDLNSSTTGLCSTVPWLVGRINVEDTEKDEVFDVWWRFSNDAFSTWAEYSGWLSYPICTVGTSYREAWDQYNTADYMYGRGEYGEARLRMVDHLVTYFQGMLDQETKLRSLV